MPLLRTPAIADALYSTYIGHAFNDPGSTDLTSSPNFVDALNFLKPVQDEILNLISLSLTGGGALRVRNQTGGTLTKGTLVAPSSILNVDEAGDGSNQLSSWGIYGANETNTNGLKLYWSLSNSGTTRTINLYKDTAKASQVATGSRVGDGVITITASNASGITGVVTVAYTIDDVDSANILTLNQFLIVKADADDRTLQPAFALKADLADVTNGVAYRGGIITGLDTSAFGAVGDDVFLSATAGSFTQTEPSGTDQESWAVGRIVTKDATVGSIEFYNDPQLRKIGTSMVQHGTAGQILYTDGSTTSWGPTGDIAMATHKITGLGDPTAAQDAATKNYVDSLIAALESKDQVQYCSTSALPANTYANGSSGVGATLTGSANGALVIDGVTLGVGQVGIRVLVAAEGTSSHNGWYTVTQVGVAVVSPYILTRATQDDQAGEMGPGYLTAVEAASGSTPGTANNQTVFISIAPSPFVVGTSNITFAVVGGTYTASSGITLTGFNFTLTAPVTAALGGTGQTSYAIGDLLYASGSTALSKLADVAAGSYLRSGGVTTAPLWSTTTLPNSATTGDLLYASASNTYTNLSGVATGNALISGGVATAPSWGKIGLTTHISGTLAVGNGGTGATTLTIHGVLLGQTTGAITATAAGATGTVLHGNTGADPTFSAVSLTADVSGVLLIANGGTNSSSSLGNSRVMVSISGAIKEAGILNWDDTNNNLGIGTTVVGTSAQKVLSITNGTAPTTSPSDLAQLYSADEGGFNTRARITTRTEDGQASSLALNKELNVNFLMNGGGDFFQRQTPGTLTAVSDDTYGPDRWNVLTQTASIQLQRTTGDTQSVNAIRMKQNQAAAQRFGMSQILENIDSKKFRSRTVNFQCRINCSNNQQINVAILEWTGTADSVTSDVVNDWTNATLTAGNFFLGASLTVTATANVTPSAATWTALSVQGTISSSCNNLIVMVWTNGTAAQNVTLDVTEAGLYDGAQSRDWLPRSYVDEFYRCQRYYNKSPGCDSGSATAAPTASPVNTIVPTAGTGNFYIPVRHPVEMRVTPTVHLYDSSGTVDKVYKGADAKTASITYQDKAGFGGGTTDTTSAGQLFFAYAADAEL